MFETVKVPWFELVWQVPSIAVSLYIYPFIPASAPVIVKVVVVTPE